MSDYTVLFNNPFGVFFDKRIANRLERHSFLTVSSIFVE
jgi:hypothetical protein